jgi:hypothetical protein
MALDCPAVYHAPLSQHHDPHTTHTHHERALFRLFARWAWHLDCIHLCAHAVAIIFCPKVDVPGRLSIASNNPCMYLCFPLLPTNTTSVLLFRIHVSCFPWWQSYQEWVTSTRCHCWLGCYLHRPRSRRWQELRLFFARRARQRAWKSVRLVVTVSTRSQFTAGRRSPASTRAGREPEQQGLVSWNLLRTLCYRVQSKGFLTHKHRRHKDIGETGILIHLFYSLVTTNGSVLLSI